MARAFNGTSDCLTIASPPTTLVSGTTIACWAKLLALTGHYGFILGNSDKGILLEMSDVGNYTCAVTNVTGAGNNFSAVVGAWTHLCMSLSSGNVSAFYVNGGAQGGNPGTPLTPASNFGIGAGVNSGLFGSMGFNGSVAEASVWERVLSLDEIQTLANGSRVTALNPANLVGYWPLGGVASPEPDQSGLGHDLTVIGTTPDGDPHVRSAPKGAFDPSLLVRAWF